MQRASQTLKTILALAAILVIVFPTAAPLAQGKVGVEPVEPFKPDTLARPRLPPHLTLLQPPALLPQSTPLGAEGGQAAAPATVKVVETVNDVGRMLRQLGVEQSKAIHVTLITGDEVFAAKTPNGTWAVFVKPVTPTRTFHVSVVGDNVYVIPGGVNLEKFSIDLFNIRLLAEYQKLGIKTIPVIVKLRKLPGENIEASFKRLLPIASKLPHITLHIIDSVALRIPPEKAATVYKELASSPIVVRVTPDYIYHATSVKAYDIVKPALYRSVPFIGAPTLWNMGVNGSGVIIAVLDTGIDPTHPDFYVGNESKILAVESFVDYNFDGQPDEPPLDGHGHGTHCAGIAAGTGGYMPQIKGVAPGALLLAGKVLSNYGWGYDSWIIKGIEWAVNNSADIISMSLGGLAYHGYDPLVDAVNKAVEKGVTVVIAAGNEGPGLFTIASPGVSPLAITVGAYDVDYGTIAGFSSRGPTVNLTVKPDVVAPGVDILAARANNTYMGEPGTLYHVYASGTSMATPHVAGYAALVLQLLNSTGILQAAEEALQVPASYIVKDVILSTATGYDEASPLVYGMGIINATNLAELVNAGMLVIPNPAHTDILAVENKVYNVTITLFNPFNETRVLSVEPILLLFPGASEAAAANAITVPSTVEVPAGGTANLTVSIDASALPVGVHAVKLLLKDNETGRVLAKAMIGIGKPALAVIRVYYEGKPVVACANILGLDLSNGAGTGSTNVYGGFYGSPTCANGTLVVGPLLPNKAYLVTVEMPSYYYGGMAAGYYIPVVVPSDDKSVIVANVTVDFAELPSVKLVVPTGNHYAMVEAYLDVKLTVTVGSQQYSLDYPALFWSSSIGEASLELHLGFAQPAAAGNVEAKAEASVFSVQSQLIPLTGTLSRVYVFYREYSSIPYGETVKALPSTLTDTLLHIHSTIGRVYEDYAGLAIFCGEQTAAMVPAIATTTGSITAYLVDSNATCSGVAIDSVEAGNVSVFAMSWWEYDYNGYRAYAPLAFPARMTTLWNYMFAWQGLDGYNFSGAIFGGNIFRTWLTGYLDISSYTEPLMYILVAPNHKSPRIYAYPSSISGIDLYWIPDNTTPPSLYVEMALNSDLLGEYGISFANGTVDFKVETVANGSYVPGITVYEFGYGVGGRDIVPLAGYDPLLNMVPQGENLALLVLFNEPIYAPVYLNQSSVTIALTNGGTTIEGTIVRWGRLGGVPLPYAIVVFPTASAPKGAYSLVVSAEYYDNTTGSTTHVSYVVSPAVYIGEPAGQLSVPAAYNVRLEASLTDIYGKPITELKPGTLAVLYANYSLIGFNGTASLVVEVVKDGETVMKAVTPVTPNSTGSIEAAIAIPWAEGTYKVKVYLLLDNIMAVLQVLPPP